MCIPHASVYALLAQPSSGLSSSSPTSQCDGRAWLQCTPIPVHSSHPHAPCLISPSHPLPVLPHYHLFILPSFTLTCSLSPNPLSLSSLHPESFILPNAVPPLQVLGRAANIRDFVQRGKEKAGVSIVLRGERPGDVVEVTRVMSLDNRSEWQLNGERWACIGHHMRSSFPFSMVSSLA